MADWLRFVRGRQKAEYYKMLLATGKFPIPFDAYLLKYPTGSILPGHKDPTPGYKHWRINIVLKKPEHSGWIWVEREEGLRIYHRFLFFRSDKYEHGVHGPIESPRWVLSIGWLTRNKS